MDALFETDEKYAELAATLAAQGVEYAFFSLIDLTEKGLDGHWEEERQYEPVHAIHSQPAHSPLASSARSTGSTPFTTRPMPTQVRCCAPRPGAPMASLRQSRVESSSVCNGILND
jgi:hypothetical protein